MTRNSAEEDSAIASEERSMNYGGAELRTSGLQL